MKKIILVFLFFGLAQPVLVNATLLGRVNAYYGEKNGEAVSKASKEYDAAIKKLSDLKDELAKSDQAIKSEKDDAKRKELEPKKKEIENNVKNATTDVQQKMVELEVAKKQLVFSSPDDDNTGVQTGTGPVSFTNTLGKEANAVSFNAYRLNLLLWQANCKYVTDDKGVKINNADGTPKTIKTDFMDNMLSIFSKQEDVSCPSDSTSHYRFVPVYFFLHKTTSAKINNDSLISDLLDNEHGGLINIKLAPTVLSKVTRDTNGNPLPTNSVLFLDFGPKYVEAPSLSDPKNTTFVGAGYLGLAINLEFGLYDAQTPSKDIIAGSKPQGGMAVGFGVYRNWIDSGGFDNSTFTSTIPNTYSTYVIGYEFQVTNLLSIAGTRSVPAESDTLGILGTYSSISAKYSFK